MKTLHIAIIAIIVMAFSGTGFAFAQIGNPWILGLESPLKQFKSGIKVQDVKCQTYYFMLIIKTEDNYPACVKPNTASELIERGWGMLVPSTTQQNIPVLSRSIMVPNTNFTINYNIEGAKVLGIKYNIQAKSLILSLETTSDGTLAISLPRALLDITKSVRGEGPFVVLEDGREASFTQISITTIDRTFSIPFTTGTHELEIAVTQII